MNSLFGVELPISVNFIIAFVIVLALIGASAWLVRRFRRGTACRGSRTPAAARRDRRRRHRRPAQAHHHPPRQRRTSADDRRTVRRRGRDQHPARGRGDISASRRRRAAPSTHCRARCLCPTRRTGRCSRSLPSRRAPNARACCPTNRRRCRRRRSQFRSDSDADAARAASAAAVSDRSAHRAWRPNSRAQNSTPHRALARTAARTVGRPISRTAKRRSLRLRLPRHFRLRRPSCRNGAAAGNRPAPAARDRPASLPGPSRRRNAHPPARSLSVWNQSRFSTPNRRSQPDEWARQRRARQRRAGQIRSTRDLEQEMASLLGRQPGKT